MKDIDFDELDRAVNSLINPDAVSTPSATTPATITEPAPVPLITPPLAERRSTGRFMDVVHPSSDMRGSVASRPVQSEPTKQSTPDPVSEPEAEPTTSWPDPIDQANAADTATEPASTPPETDTDDANGPLESPFLADAKVEKRPLGAFSNEVHDSGPSIPASVPAATEPDLESLSLDSPLEVTSKSEDHPIENDTPLPAELQPGLLSIEANEDPNATKADDAAAEATPIGPTSITPQYTQQPSTGDKPAGNIFDTQAYKKPQTAKGKKSGLFVVLWIFLLLIVGAGIGAAVYFFVLPRL
ncbi:MAG: hypothetical protein JWN26_373 [Candidatus Saccharibacteria bacterium]|nr:hypothetical protein [Candidatus Saccharibacteria bacterium]